jgi:malate synthase
MPSPAKPLVSPAPAASPVSGLNIRGPMRPGYESILTADALTFWAGLERRFRGPRNELLRRRTDRQLRLDAGEWPDFLPETRRVREGTWQIAPVPADLLDRRVEITGPVERKMVINALNSGANVFMADFEDSTAPTWCNLLDGQVNLRDAVRGTIEWSGGGKEYRLQDRTATLVVRPRGWHLPERHVELDGQPVSGSLFDFALYFFHNCKALLQKGTGPYFYLPKLESHLEARLWNDVFVAAQGALGIPRGTIKATVLIETLLAAFEMDEILHELRDHSAGLNCGRWDYIFSFIKKLRNHPACVLPDRGTVTMTQHFLQSYSLLLVKTCHRRGAHAMGGMAAQIPVKDDPAKNEAALAKVRADKQREVQNGHDGTWVAHPALVAVAREQFDAVMKTPNQLHVARADVQVGARDLLTVPKGAITEAGLRQDLNVGVLYLEAWLRGQGCVPLDHLMEDAATAEISRAQVWQWLHHRAQLQDGRVVDGPLVQRILAEEMDAIRRSIGTERYAAGRYEAARALFERLTTAPVLEDFLTLPAYEQILDFT